MGRRCTGPNSGARNDAPSGPPRGSVGPTRGGSDGDLLGHRPGGQPWVARGVLAGVVGVEVDEAALDLPVADLEDVAPATRAPFRHAGAPRAVLVLAVAGALAHHGVGPGEDPVEVCV